MTGGALCILRHAGAAWRVMLARRDAAMKRGQVHGSIVDC